MSEDRWTNSVSIERYRRRAAGDDASALDTMPLRQRTIELLELKRGQAVLDVGCGTGLSFEWSHAACRHQHHAAGQARGQSGGGRHEVFSLVAGPAEPAALAGEPPLQRQGSRSVAPLEPDRDLVPRISSDRNFDPAETHWKFSGLRLAQDLGALTRVGGGLPARPLPG